MRLELADGAPEHAGGAGRFAQPLTVAVRAAGRAGEPAHHGALALGLLVGGVQVDALEPVDHALVVLRQPPGPPHRRLAVQQRRAVGRGPLAQRGGHVEGAGVGVLPVPVLALAEPGQQDRALLQRLVQVQQAFDGGGQRLPQSRAGRAHPGRVVEGEVVALADVRFAHPGEQQPQVGVGVGGGADRGPRVPAEPLLVDQHDRGQPFHRVGVRAAPPRQPVAHERRVVLVDLVPGFGRDRVEDQGGLARTGDPGEHDQLAARQVQVERLQVVGAGAPDADRSTHAATVRTDAARS
ncbi:hypothetical protein [Saccharopolyspora hordei]|uniref:Uncharacterized protein n=1 Tax=Saccharopolyspora hordei TaxID=1838 RepID=A0A853AKH7_9PSEU|nr:hypothetical protein [Saccharopolyspora hordei]